MKNFILFFALSFFTLMGNAQKTAVYFNTGLDENISIGLGHSTEDKKFILSIVNEYTENSESNMEFIVNGTNLLDSLKLDTSFNVKTSKKREYVENDYLVDGFYLMRLLDQLKNETNVYICGERFLGNDVYTALNELNKDFVAPGLREGFLKSMSERQQKLAKNSHVRFGFGNFRRTIKPPFIFFRMPKQQKLNSVNNK